MEAQYYGHSALDVGQITLCSHNNLHLSCWPRQYRSPSRTQTVSQVYYIACDQISKLNQVSHMSLVWTACFSGEFLH